MKLIGGDITSITLNHPDLGSFNFKAKSGESYNLDPGGIRNNDDAESVSTDGIPIWKKTRKLAFFEGAIVTDFLTGLEFENLPKLAESVNDGDLTISHISGAIWKITGQPVGEFSFDTMEANLPIKFVGAKLEPIV